MTTLTEKPKAKTKVLPEHRDKLGRKLSLGDVVAYPRKNTLQIGKIVKLNPKMPTVLQLSNASKYDREHNIYPTDMVLLDGADVTFYILKNSA